MQTWFRVATQTSHLVRHAGVGDGSFEATDAVARAELVRMDHRVVAAFDPVPGVVTNPHAHDLHLVLLHVRVRQGLTECLADGVVTDCSEKGVRLAQNI